MTVAVVIPCRNEAAHIASLLDALAGQSRQPDEIVVVNDRSTDSTADEVRVWRQAHADVPVRVIDGPGKGPGPAMNAGIRTTTADIVMRVDGHARPAPEYLAQCLDVLNDPAVGVAGGVWEVIPGAPTPVGRAIAGVVSHPLGSGGARYRHADATGPLRMSVETAPFGTFRRSLWETLGGFDESLAANQDFDFNYRARLAGFTVMLDRRIRATYMARPTLGSLARQYRRYGYWKVKMLQKDPRALHFRQLPPAIVLPWTAATFVWVALSPGLLSVTAAALYPALIVAGGVHVALTRAVRLDAAVAALATLHLSWSAGAWQAVLHGAPPR